MNKSSRTFTESKSNKSSKITQQKKKSGSSSGILDNHGPYLADSIKFLSAISGLGLEDKKLLDEVFRFQLICSNKGLKEYLEKEGIKCRALPQYESFPGTIKKHIKALEAWNNPSFGGYYDVYCTINEVDRKAFGRGAENIVGIRAFFADFDSGLVTDEEVKWLVENLSPTLITQTSKGKIHVIWCLKDFAEIPVDRFKQVQGLLYWKIEQFGIETLGLDWNVNTVERVLRIPGFRHLKSLLVNGSANLDETFHSRLIYFEPANRFDYRGLTEDVFEIQPEDLEKFQEYWREKRQNETSFLADGRESGSGLGAQAALEYKGAEKDLRNKALHLFASKFLNRHPSLTPEQLTNFLVIEDKKNSPPIMETDGISEIQTIVESVFKFHAGVRSGTGQGALVGSGERLDEIGITGILDDPAKKFEHEAGLQESGIDIGEEAKKWGGYKYNHAVHALAIDPGCDLAYAERLFQRYGDKFRIVAESSGDVGLKLNEDTGIWEPFFCSKESVTVLQHEYKTVVLESELEQAIKAKFISKDGSFSDEKRDRFFCALGSASRARGIAQLFLDRAELLIESAKLNSHVELVPAGNGLLDLIAEDPFNMMLSPEAARDFFFTKRIGTEFRETATCSMFEKFIRDLFSIHLSSGELDQEATNELVEFVQQVIGIVLAGDVGNQKFFVLFGSGGNGKSAFLNIISALMGSFSDLFPASVITAKKLVGRGNSDYMSASRDSNFVLSSLAQMENMRFCCVEEIPTDSAWNIDLLKTLTGGDEIKVKQLYKDSRSMRVSFNLFVRANSLPSGYGVDEAFLDRVVILPFENRFRGAECEIKEIDKQIIKNELSGVLNWAIEGYRKYALENNRKLKIPAVCLAAKESYTEDMDKRSYLVSKLFKATPEPCISLDEIHALIKVTEILIGDAEGVYPDFDVEDAENQEAIDEWLNNVSVINYLNEEFDKAEQTRLGIKLKSLGINQYDKRVRDPNKKRIRVYYSSLGEWALKEAKSSIILVANYLYRKNIEHQKNFILRCQNQKYFEV